MKKLQALIAIATISALALSSCKKDLSTNDEFKTNDEAAMQGRVVNNSAPVYTMVRFDKDSLIYDNKKRLVKVIHAPTAFTTYSYGQGTITSEKTVNGKVEVKHTYSLDVRKNRVSQSLEEKYSYYAGGIIVTTGTTFLYEYGIKGNLWSRSNKAKPYERTTYSFGDDSSIVTLASYDEHNETNHKIYYPSSGQPNKAGLVPASFVIDPYLDIFGMRSKVLPSQEWYYMLTSGDSYKKEGYTYKFNPDGFPVSCIVSDELTHTRLRSFTLNYLVK